VVLGRGGPLVLHIDFQSVLLLALVMLVLLQRELPGVLWGSSLLVHDHHFIVSEVGLGLDGVVLEVDLHHLGVLELLFLGPVAAVDSLLVGGAAALHDQPRFPIELWHDLRRQLQSLADLFPIQTLVHYHFLLHRHRLVHPFHMLSIMLCIMSFTFDVPISVAYSSALLIIIFEVIQIEVFLSAILLEAINLVLLAVEALLFAHPPLCVAFVDIALVCKEVLLAERLVLRRLPQA